MPSSDPVDVDDYETAIEESSDTDESDSSDSKSDSTTEDESEVANTLVPEPRILRDRTSKVKPTKYTSDPVDVDDYETAIEESSDTDESDSSDSKSDSTTEDESEVANTLVPEPRILRDRTSKVKPTKYTSDPVDVNDYETAIEESSDTDESDSSDSKSDSTTEDESEVANTLVPEPRILRDRTSKTEEKTIKQAKKRVRETDRSKFKQAIEMRTVDRLDDEEHQHEEMLKKDHEMRTIN
ncbi:hypothetical protein MJO29_001077 [Puccinia striiformis f. sp. tritici]|nr:hypothetical protein MJO29_001077 [Puccinia striiformis f. sp. tritici]